MTRTSSTLLRTSAIALAAGLGLAGCSSDTNENQPGGAAEPNSLDTVEAPETTEEETALAETLEEDFDVTETLTLQEQWPDITSMASALAGTAEPDLCQEAGTSQYGLFVNAQPANVRANVADDALIDDNASGETIHAFYANEEATAQRLQEAHQDTDTACVEEDDAIVEHETSQRDVNGEAVEIHTWQIIVSEQLTGRMIDVVGDETYVRYSAAYPPQVMVEELDDDVADFNEEATERATAAFEAAQAQ